MGPWASGSGVLGNDPGEGNASPSGHALFPGVPGMGGAGETARRGKSVAAIGGAAASQPRTENLQVSKRSACEVSKILHQLCITLLPWLSFASSPRF